MAFQISGEPNALVGLSLNNIPFVSYQLDSSGIFNYAQNTTANDAGSFSLSFFNIESENGCEVDLMNQHIADITVNDTASIQNVNIFDTNGNAIDSICTSDTIFIEVTGTPNAEISINTDSIYGLSSTYLLDDLGYALIEIMVLSEFTEYININSTSLNACQTNYDNFVFPISVFQTPLVVIEEGPTSICENSYDDLSWNVITYPNHTFEYIITGFPYPQSGTITADSTGISSISYLQSTLTIGTTYTLTITDVYSATCLGFTYFAPPNSITYEACSSNCVDSLVLNNYPEFSGLYKVSHFIVSNSEVNFLSGGDVTYQAENDYIELQSGFEADGSVNFDAVILPCE